MDKDLVKLREVLVYNQPKQKHYIFQTATDKWTELAEMIKNEPTLEVNDINQMRAVVHSTQNTLELPNAIIPEGAQKIFLFEAKVKSGSLDYTKLDFGGLRRLAKSKGIEGLGSNPTKTSLIDALEKVAGITKKKESKISKLGRTSTKTVKVESKNTPLVRKEDKKILDEQPSLQERVSALEGAFEKLVIGLHESCSNFVKPIATPTILKIQKKVVEEKIGDFDINELNKEAAKLKI